MPLINCKIKLNLTWKKECVLSTDNGNAVFIINDTKMYVPVVTLSKEDNKDFIEQQNKGLQRSIYWNEYKTKEINENADANVFKYINLDPSFQGVNRLFVMAYNRENGQPIINLLDKDDTDSKHFATKKWYIINDEYNTNYGVNKDTGANNRDTIKYDTRVLKPNLCDYAEAYILVDGIIRAANTVNATRLALKLKNGI